MSANNEAKKWVILALEQEIKDDNPQLHILCEVGDEKRALAHHFSTQINEVGEGSGNYETYEVDGNTFQAYAGEIENNEIADIETVDLRSRNGEFRDEDEIEEDVRIENEKNWVILIRQDDLGSSNNSCSEHHVYCNAGDEERVLALEYENAESVSWSHEIETEDPDGSNYESHKVFEVLTPGDGEEGDEDEFEITNYASYKFGSDIGSRQSSNYGAEVSDYRTSIALQKTPA
jgi:hypothetical protein